MTRRNRSARTAGPRSRRSACSRRARPAARLRPGPAGHSRDPRRGHLVTRHLAHHARRHLRGRGGGQSGVLGGVRPAGQVGGLDAGHPVGRRRQRRAGSGGRGRASLTAAVRPSQDLNSLRWRPPPTRASAGPPAGRSAPRLAAPRRPRRLRPRSGRRARQRDDRGKLRRRDQLADAGHAGHDRRLGRRQLMRRGGVTAVSFGPPTDPRGGQLRHDRHRRGLPTHPWRRLAAAQPAGVRPAGAARRGRRAGPDEGGADRAVDDICPVVLRTARSRPFVKQGLDRVAPLPVTAAVRVGRSGHRGARTGRRCGCCSPAGGGDHRRRRTTRGGCCRPCPPSTRRSPPGPGHTTDALAVSGSTLTVWQLARGGLGEGPADHRADPVRFVQLAGRVRRP